MTPECPPRRDELELTAAALAGDHAAICRFDREFLSPAISALTRMGLSEDDRQELKQRALARLLVPNPGARSPLSSFEGRGSLRSWLRTYVVRAAIKKLEREQRELPTDDEFFERITDLRSDPAMRALRSNLTDQVRSAVLRATRSLESRERLLLRQHYGDGLGIDKLGQLYSVHRSTVARWIESARDALRRAVRGELSRSTPLQDSEIGSVLAALQSRIDLSMHTLFAESVAADSRCKHVQSV